MKIMAARTLTLILFLANLNCIWIDAKDRHNLPDGLARRICPEPTTKDADPLVYATPTRRLSDSEIPLFDDDLDLAGMEIAIARQLKRYRERSMTGEVVFGTDRYSLHAVKESLKRFRTIMHQYKRCMGSSPEKGRGRCLNDFQRVVREDFAVYVPNLEPADPRFGEPEPVLFTGYYTPLIYASESRRDQYKYPIYAKPTDAWYSRTGRYAIDFKEALKYQGLELFFAPDRLDLYLLHLEGGGHVRYEDAEGNPRSIYLSYAGSNGRKWRYLSAQMIEKNWISNPALPKQREFIDANPDLAPEIFSYCPSYVYFKKSELPPEGSDRVPLTDNRSIATDSALYGFKGALAFVRAKRPKADESPIEMIPFSRFVLDQDTGGSIKGKARVDFYFGEGSYAQLAANSVKQRGDLFYLMLKP